MRLSVPVVTLAILGQHAASGPETYRLAAVNNNKWSGEAERECGWMGDGGRDE